jgi:hypothetical protein
MRYVSCTYRRCKALRHHNAEAQIFSHDNRQKIRYRVGDEAREAKVQRKAPNLPVLALGKVFPDVELGHVCVTAVSLDALDHELELFRLEEFPGFVSVLWEVDEEEVANDGNDDGDDSLPLL